MPEPPAPSFFFNGHAPRPRNLVALVTGVAGTFTACSIAVFSALAPQSGGDQSGNGSGLPGRTIQAMVVFGLIGAMMTYLGLVALGFVHDPLAKVSRKHPSAPMLFTGGLIGAFLVGRPFPLFRQLFRDAAESHNVLYGAVAFAFQSLGNILVMAVGFIVAGVFLLLYGDVRIPARRDLIWYPIAPWAA
ncbi:hypothetical protein ABZ565_26985 [Streptomyces sp. NPDC016469]|uniref:hypothetical protein n=1 Tax=Streptomyces sp. NPDC016469 TaxID=3157191 RepID=UPI0033EC28AF